MKDKSQLILIIAGALALIFTAVVTFTLGLWGLIGIALIAGLSAFLGRCYAPKPEEQGEDLLRMKIQSLEMQLADEREMVAALTNELDPTDF